MSEHPKTENKMTDAVEQLVEVALKERSGESRQKDKSKSNVRPTKAESNVRTEAPAVRHDDAPPSDVNAAEQTNNAKDSGDDASARRAAARERLRACRSQRNRRSKKDEFRSKGPVERRKDGPIKRTYNSNSAEVENLKASVRRSAKNALKNAKSAGKSKITDVNVEPTGDERSPENLDGISSKIANAASEGESSTKLLSRLKGRLKANEKSETTSPGEVEDAPKQVSASKRRSTKISTQNNTSVQDLKARLKSKKRDEVDDESKAQTGGGEDTARVAADAPKNQDAQLAVTANDTVESSTAKKRAAAKLKSR